MKMKNSKKCKFNALGLAGVGVCVLVLSSGVAQAAQEGEAATADVKSDIASTPMEMLSNGSFNGHARVIYFHSENAYYSPGLDQDTASYGGKLGFKTAKYNGLSFGVSGYVQRPLSRSSDPSKVDGYVGRRCCTNAASSIW